jgi:hypothetical protein
MPKNKFVTFSCAMLYSQRNSGSFDNSINLAQIKFMKTPLTFLLMLVCGVLAAQADYDAFQLGLNYSAYTRPDFDTYLEKVSSDTRLKGTLVTPNDFGMSFSVLRHRGRGEFQFGMNYQISRKNQKGDTLDYIVQSRTSDWNIYMGGNWLPVNWFLLGAHGGVNAFDGDIKTYGSVFIPSGSTLEPPPGDPKIFGGYSWFVRSQAGFVFPYKQDGWKTGHTVRLIGYWQIGTNNNFYDQMGHQYAPFSGSKKTKASAWGASLQFTFGRE